MAERTTVRLPGDLVRRARRKARDEGRTLTALIEEGLRRVLKDSPGKKRGMPRVSKAGGGLVPGIDLDDTAMLLEMDDLDSARRLQ